MRKAKIEGLTNAWYGFAVFSAIFSLVTNGIGVFSIVSTALSLFVFSTSSSAILRLMRSIPRGLIHENLLVASSQPKKLNSSLMW